MSKYSTDDFEAQEMPVVVAVAQEFSIPVPVSVASSAPYAPTAAAPGYDDVAPAAVSYASGYDDKAGRRIGMATFVCIVLDLLLSWIAAEAELGLVIVLISYICQIAATVFASIITCGCCRVGGSKFNLNPKVKRWAVFTLLCLVGNWVVTIIIVGEGEGEGEDGVHALAVIYSILCILAAMFAGIFTWGRKSCGNA
jgi:hypothetical protein